MKKIKVLIAKAGLDGHDRGALVVAQGLKDAGMEVVYTGIRQTPEDVVAAAIDEDVDVIGLSSLSGAHVELCRRMATLMKRQKVRGKAVFVGGIIPQEDHDRLRRLGVRGIFPPGSSLAQIVSFIQKHVRR